MLNIQCTKTVNRPNWFQGRVLHLQTINYQVCTSSVLSHSLQPHGLQNSRRLCEAFQSRILEWVSIPSSRGSSQPRDQTCVSCIGKCLLYHLSHLGSPSITESHLYKSINATSFPFNILIDNIIENKFLI